MLSVLLSEIKQATDSDCFDMGKHKNKVQNSIILDFMKKHPDIAKGFTKRDKTQVKFLWHQLADALNGAGPPQKDADGWRKTWTEWKSDVKRKLVHNKVESRATGGGAFSKHNLTQTEEAIVRICSISKSVSGISFGSSESAADVEKDETNNVDDGDEIPSSAIKRRIVTSSVCNTPKKSRGDHSANRLNAFLNDENKAKDALHNTISELIVIEKENGSSLKRIYRSLEKFNDSVTNAITEFKDEYVKVNTRMLSILQEKNELKKQQLDLDLIKFKLEKEKM